MFLWAAGRELRTIDAAEPSSDGGDSWHAPPVDDHWNVPANSLSFSVDNAETYIIGFRAGNDAGWSSLRNSTAAGPFTP